MSLIIRGMNMPTSCEWCRFISGGLEWYCEAGQIQIYDYKTVHKDCPLINIPTPHGRLIDADSLIEYINKELKGDEYIQRMFRRIIKSRPTVIEAEE